MQTADSHSNTFYLSFTKSGPSMSTPMKLRVQVSLIATNPHLIAIDPHPQALVTARI